MVTEEDGSALWVALLTFAGYFLGRNYQLVEKYLGPISSFILIALIVGFAFWVIKRIRKSKKGQAKNH